MHKIDFQEKKQDELVLAAMQLLGGGGRRVLTFKAPTGAGKTVMMANTLAQLSKAAEGTHHLVIIWVAPNKLHEQSLARLREVYGATRALDCLLFEDVSGTALPDKAVLFLNWSSIDSENLVLRRDNETRRNLESVICQGRDAGKKIILVVDESHLHLDSGPQAQIVVDHIIKPDLVIEVSATPRAKATDYTVTVLREDVLAANLIRKRVIVNPGSVSSFEGSTLVTNYSGTSENLLDAALEKQAELTRLLKAEGSAVVPLILIQLPDRRSDPEALARFEEYLSRVHNLYRKNGTVAVWLSGDRTPEVEDIAKFGSPVRVLFFKNAIATGWDCPRAQIMVGLREMKSETFTTQVLGRIIRQPEHKAYACDDLNYAYAFTNYEKLELDAETASWMGKVVIQRQKPFALTLPNWYDQRADRRGHLTTAIVPAALGRIESVRQCKHEGAVTRMMVIGGVIDVIDEQQTIDGTRAVTLELKALQEQLDRLKAELVRETASQTKGQKYLEKALRDVAQMLTGSSDEQVLLETILHKDNVEAFRGLLQLCIEDVLATQEKAARTLVERAAWDAPATRFIDLSAPMDGYTRCLYKPVLAGQFQPSNVEEPFSRLLDGNPLVDLWLKNGDNGSDHFALKYQLDAASGEWFLFYVDFLVHAVNGSVRLYETKGSSSFEGGTGNSEQTHAKARALYQYIQEQKAAGIDIDGGIVVLKKDKWWLHDGNNYSGTKEVSEQNGWREFVF
nr:DEAD/DEAH box helicase family protein [Rhodoferax sp.]